MSKQGTSTFIIQRASAVVLIPLAIWFLIGMVAHLGADYTTARAWLTEPFNAFILGAFIIVAAWHMRIGMAEIIVDYIHSWMRAVLLLLNWIVALGLIAAAAWSIYNIMFVGG